MHRLLQRQIHRFLGDAPTLTPEFAQFLEAVHEAYTSADADKLLIERSLKLMSQELTEANAGLRNELAEHQRAELALKIEHEEQRLLIKKLEETQNQLMQSEKLASIGQLAAGVAHEINNPIGYVYSNLGTLKNYVLDVFSLLDGYEAAESAISDAEVRSRLQALKDKLDIVFMKEDLRALVEESKEGITRVKTIVQSLKDFAHADVEAEWQFADLQRGLNSTLNIVNNEIKYKADVIRKYADIPEVECLPSQLNQVFLNLLVNAAHAIENRGTITIRTEHQNNEVCVEISDTGKGIAPEYMQKIFDPFFTTKPIGKGTGLGLSLSYGIIQKHQGRIEVKSELGKGTSFKIWLPVQHNRAEKLDGLAN
jgi:signal transduction histidine kinase